MLGKFQKARNTRTFPPEGESGKYKTADTDTIRRYGLTASHIYSVGPAHSISAWFRVERSGRVHGILTRITAVQL